MLDEVGQIEKIDRSNMRGILKNFPGQCEEAVKMADNLPLPAFSQEEINRVVICGLGGSAIGGDILRTLFCKVKTTIHVNRNYFLPSFVNEKTVVLATSYSGNTEETISSFKQALQKGCLIFAISSGGELEKLSKQKGIHHLKVPGGMPPRCAVGYLTIPMIKLLEKILRVKLFNYKELVDVLGKLSERYHPEIKTENNFTKQMALKLKGKIPLIYGVDGLTDVVAHRWKTQFNENSKILASWNTFPEMNHNEVVPWSGEGEIDLNLFYPIFLRDKAELRRISKRIEITQDLIKEKGVEYSEIWTEGECLLSRIFSLIYTGDWISFYLAISQSVDPTPIKFIELLKNELKKFTSSGEGT